MKNLRKYYEALVKLEKAKELIEKLGELHTNYKFTNEQNELLEKLKSYIEKHKDKFIVNYRILVQNCKEALEKLNPYFECSINIDIKKNEQVVLNDLNDPDYYYTYDYKISFNLFDCSKLSNNQVKVDFLKIVQGYHHGYNDYFDFYGRKDIKFKVNLLEEKYLDEIFKPSHIINENSETKNIEEVIKETIWKTIKESYFYKGIADINRLTQELTNKQNEINNLKEEIDTIEKNIEELKEDNELTL